MSAGGSVPEWSNREAFSDLRIVPPPHRSRFILCYFVSIVTHTESLPFSFTCFLGNDESGDVETCGS